MQTTTVPGTTTAETTAETTATTPAGKRLLGDANCSGKVDVSDAVLTARTVNEDRTAVITDQGKRNADCNQNGNVDSEDITMILRHIAKIELLPETE